jgi:hypothetical protein
MNNLTQASAPGKPNMGPAGERELLLTALRVAAARSRLVTNLLETVGVSLRHKQVSTEAAMQWLRDEGVLHLIDLEPPGARS